MAIFHPCLADTSLTPKNPLLEDATMEFIDGVFAAPPTKRVESAVAVMMNLVAVIILVLSCVVLCCIVFVLYCVVLSLSCIVLYCNVLYLI